MEQKPPSTQAADMTAPNTKQGKSDIPDSNETIKKKGKPEVTDGQTMHAKAENRNHQATKTAKAKSNKTEDPVTQPHRDKNEENNKTTNQKIEESGLFSARPSIVQSSAIAVQDATDNLRNLNTISTTAIGSAFSQLVSTGDLKYLEMIQGAQNVVATGAENFNLVGQKAARIIKEFLLKQ